MLANVAAACMLLLSVYAHWSLPREIEGERRVRLTQLLLASVGTVLGLFAVGFAQFVDIRGTSALALFLIGFGQVHAPAAVVMLLKTFFRIQRAEEPIR
jgi:hypothetical protein